MALHIAWSPPALQRGFGFETALFDGCNNRYRLLFPLIVLAMLAR
jgi:hypothetical protein